MNKELDTENLKKKIVEKDKAKLKYKQKLELVKQHYGIEFDIYYFNNENIDKIKFSDLEYKNAAKNISLVYDNKIGKFNYILYDYDNEQSMKNFDDKKIINGLNREKKLKLVVAEVKRLNEEYRKELEEIEERFTEKTQEYEEQLEIKKKVENN